MTEQVGRVLGGRYRILSPLGSGASAEVYLGDDVRLHRRVAIKLLHPALAQDEAFLRRFRAEAQAAAALSHPNIVAVYDWNGEDQPYLVTEYLKGGSLRAILDAGHRLSPSQALVVGLQAAKAMDVAHRQGFVHRDIKPANLLFGGDGRLRVADFGLARAVAEAAMTEPSGAVTGTARYSSPEQARGEPLTGESDIYSLGLVLIEAVTGRVPFAADTTIGTLMARMDEPVEVPEELDALAPVLAKVGEVEAKDRPDAATLAAQLLSAATELPRPAPLPLVGQPALTDGASDTADRTMVHQLPPIAAPPPLPVPQPPSGDGNPALAPTAASSPAAAPALAAAAAGPPSPPSAPPAVLPGQSGGPAGPATPSGGVRVAAAAKPRRSGRRRRLPGWVVPTLAVAFALAVGAGGAWFLREASVPSYAVPDELIGAQISEISTIIGENGWQIEQTTERADDTVEGQILRVEPGPGSQLRRGEELQVVVSLGPTLVEVPQIEEGLPLDEAEQRLDDAELRLGEVQEQEHETIPDDSVISVAEGTENELPKGSAVNLVVSSGPPWPTIPNLEGWRPGDARNALEELDFEVDWQNVNDDSVDSGRVVGTNPGAGEQLEPGSTVVVYISRGNGNGNGGDDGIAVPYVIGMTFDEATEAVEDAGLEVGEGEGGGDSRVFYQDPPANSTVDPDTEVNLYGF